MKRNPLNTNHRLHYGPSFQGHQVLSNCGPLISNHLQRVHACFERSLHCHKRTCLMRVDLYIPPHAYPPAVNSNQFISKFFASLGAKIEHAQDQSMKLGHRVHQTDVRYIWCREVSSNGRVHYHVALLLNHDAYAFMGQFSLDCRNMYARLHEAWGAALNMHPEDVVGYVHIPKNPTYQIVKDDEESFQQAFNRVSYFAKMQTKEYNQGFHTFGCSNN